MMAIFKSYSHSHAYQACPPMVMENGSVRVTVCVRSICSPLRICQPMPASPSRRPDSAGPQIAANKIMKIKSLTDGIRNRNHAARTALPEPVSICAEFEAKVCRTHPTCYRIEWSALRTENQKLKTENSDPPG